MENIRLIFLLVSLGVGAIVTLIAVWLFGGKIIATRAQKAIAESTTPAPKIEKDEQPIASAELKGFAKTLAEAGIRIPITRFYLLVAAACLLTILAGWIFFIPGLPSIALGGIVVYGIYSYIKDRSQSRGKMIDDQLPLTMARISVGLQIGTHIITIFEDAAKHLPANHPLASELFQTAQEMRTYGEADALGRLADRSSSISLSNAAMMLQSFARAGGSQYADAVASAAVNIQKMVEVRNTARARATQAQQTAAVVPLMLGFTLVTMAADPTVGESFRQPIVQIVIVITMLIMGGGFLFIRNQVRKVV